MTQATEVDASRGALGALHPHRLRRHQVPLRSRAVLVRPSWVIPPTIPAATFPPSVPSVRWSPTAEVQRP
jgi:hypothetical protein